MTTKQYLAALEKLGFKSQSETAAALGVSVRQVRRYAAGETLPPMLVKLIECLLSRKASSF